MPIALRIRHTPVQHRSHYLRHPAYRVWIVKRLTAELQDEHPMQCDQNLHVRRPVPPPLFLQLSALARARCDLVQQLLSAQFPLPGRAPLREPRQGHRATRLRQTPPHRRKRLALDPKPFVQLFNMFRQSRFLSHTFFTFHIPHLVSRISFHVPRSTLHAPRFTLHAPRSTLHAPRFTLHAPRFTFHISRSTFHVSRFTFHVPRFTFHVPRFTFHVPRFTIHASPPSPYASPCPSAYRSVREIGRASCRE